MVGACISSPVKMYVVPCIDYLPISFLGLPLSSCKCSFLFPVLQPVSCLVLGVEVPLLSYHSALASL